MRKFVFASIVFLMTTAVVPAIARPPQPAVSTTGVAIQSALYGCDALAIYRVNPTTGELTYFVPNPGATFLAADSTRGVLYAFGHDSKQVTKLWAISQNGETNIAMVIPAETPPDKGQEYWRQIVFVNGALYTTRQTYLFDRFGDLLPQRPVMCILHLDTGQVEVLNFYAPIQGSTPDSNGNFLGENLYRYNSTNGQIVPGFGVSGMPRTSGAPTIEPITQKIYAQVLGFNDPYNPPYLAVLDPLTGDVLWQSTNRMHGLSNLVFMNSMGPVQIIRRR